MSLPFSPPTQKDNAFAALRQFVRKRPMVERCEMCSSELPGEHQHLIDPAARKLVCACDACAILFSHQSSTKYRRVPRRIRFLPQFQMTESQWDGLMVPIEMAFFFKGGTLGKVAAFYPGPAGATESLLSLEAWGDIERSESGASRNGTGRGSPTSESRRRHPRSRRAVLYCSNRRVLQARRPNPPSLAWAFGRH